MTVRRGTKRPEGAFWLFHRASGRVDVVGASEGRRALFMGKGLVYARGGLRLRCAGFAAVDTVRSIAGLQRGFVMNEHRLYNAQLFEPLILDHRVLIVGSGPSAADLYQMPDIPADVRIFTCKLGLK